MYNLFRPRRDHLITGYGKYEEGRRGVRRAGITTNEVLNLNKLQASGFHSLSAFISL
jgi:hypothetical protein